MTAKIDASSSPSRRRGRPRDRETDQKILEAARTLLDTRGFDSLSFDAISQMTGITRATIYRRWPSKMHLAAEIANGAGGRPQFPDVISRRSLATQVRTIVRQVVEHYAQPGAGAAGVGLISAYHHDPDLRAELHSQLENGARERLAAVVRRGIELGKIDASIDPDSLFDLIVGATIFRAMISAHELPPTFIDDVTDILVHGLAPR